MAELEETPPPASTRNARPRVAVVSPFLDRRHGTESRVVECLERLAGDYEFHVYSQRVEDTDLSRVQWHRVPSLPGPHLLGFLWWLAANHAVRWWRQKERRFRYDLVFTPGINCFDADLIAVHIVFAEFLRQAAPHLKFSDYPAWFWPRLAHRRLYYRLIIALEKQIYPHHEVHLAAVSRKTAHDLQAFYGRTNGMRVVYSGLDLDAFSPEQRTRLRAGARAALGYAENDFVVLLVGNDFVKKGLRSLLDAAEEVSRPDLRVLVVGEDDPSPFADQPARPGLRGRVQFVPTRRDVAFYYAAADAYAGPSLEDAFALPPAEAMACGLPVIVSRQAGVSELITHGVDGFILEDARDAAALSARLATLAEDSALRQRIGTAAARTARRCTWERHAAEMKQLFEDALQSRKKRELRATP